MTLNEKQHIVRQYDKDLNHLLSLLLTMGSLVQNQLHDALKVIRGSEEISARDVVAADEQVNALEVAVDEACVTLIARRQPLADDLRFIITILKVAAELERIGDSVDKMSQTALHDDITIEKTLLDKIDVMAQDAIAMLHDTLRAFSSMSLDEAKSVYARDIKIDERYKEITLDAKEGMKNRPESVDSLLTAILTARAIERIGDRCQNICEFIYYYLKGKDIRDVAETVF
ncbi:phosphate signaling complex protein PhoU [Testudinibacter sp. TR-2022]|uniref:phosphate signaling complex protein PhoU n=1 Tax=Testudinibacter sp. TR-2022 TaxID=2585029 RepID=UPI00111802AB|nr:phosphate signaling complex protein PhoU [Testudinibacter sp. TR-2022]TNH03505.1 phosphate signaling complex protein PhoU [Pasteurellaceae bacterium Phil31]TNH07923.1 phosphate signaling complex protein PhoU [Testudinibacter sp. TR-2022]TNH10340.1 phosphate signaling complex protein PhoU [Testudinibacter sp. TR-2022]TNH14506.1 phosphate signaling complex protein PhoU [Testudinibacter sp. TR-2022]TNH20826.1 phosphate signaling complex protein PhoU [Testudinibacter sp. TR-2022]